MPELITIGLVGLSEAGVDARIRRGILQYARPHRPWLIIDAKHDRSLFHRITGGRVDGVVAHVTDKLIQTRLRRLRRPIINLANVMPDCALPTLCGDDHAAGRLAAEHLAERSLTRAGLILANTGHHYNNLRAAGFIERTEQLGVVVDRYQPDAPPADAPVAQRERMRQQQLDHWVRQLAPPAGVFAGDDRTGIDVINACRRLGIDVPDDIAVLGVGDAENHCELCYPPLSSVRPPAERIGAEAAALLERMIQGEPAPHQPILLPPEGVSTRMSSDVFAIEDALLRKALRFIHDHADQRFTVGDMATALRANRRDLERRFQRYLQRTPFEEIQRVQIERAKHVLLHSDLPMSHVAERAGFRDGNHLAVVFGRLTGITPTQYRKQHRYHHAT